MTRSSTARHWFFLEKLEKAGEGRARPARGTQRRAVDESPRPSLPSSIFLAAVPLQPCPRITRASSPKPLQLCSETPAFGRLATPRTRLGPLQSRLRMRPHLPVHVHRTTQGGEERLEKKRPLLAQQDRATHTGFPLFQSFTDSALRRPRQTTPPHHRSCARWGSAWLKRGCPGSQSNPAPKWDKRNLSPCRSARPADGRVCPKLRLCQWILLPLIMFVTGDSAARPGLA